MEQREQPASEEQARGVTDDAASPSRSDSTAEAGADAHPDDLDADLEEILGDLFDMFAAGVARARWPLEAEVHVSEVLGRLEATLAEDGLLPPDAEDGDPLGLLFAQVVAHAQGLRTARGLAVLRALAVFADDDFREHVTSVADDLATSGIKEPAWARTIGTPTVERCRHGPSHPASLTPWPTSSGTPTRRDSPSGTHRAPTSRRYASTKQRPFPHQRLCCPPCPYGATEAGSDRGWCSPAHRHSRGLHRIRPGFALRE